MEENLGIVPIDKINKEKIEENDGDDNLMDLEWTEKDFLNKMVDIVEYRYNNIQINIWQITIFRRTRNYITQ